MSRGGAAGGESNRANRVVVSLSLADFGPTQLPPNKKH
jgi:hypothetical protein